MKIPRQGATVLQFVVEESRGDAWRPVASSSSQVEALAELDRFATSYARRVVQVVAVRLPVGPPSAGELEALAREQNPAGRGLADPLPLACAIQDCEAPRAFGRRWCAAHLLGQPADPEYSGDRYAEDFPRPRGVTP